jgi:hypothetical protein
MATQQPVDSGQSFDSYIDDILDFSERNPFGEADNY